MTKIPLNVYQNTLFKILRQADYIRVRLTAAVRSEQTEIFERQVSVSSGHPLPSSADLSISQYVAIREVAGSAR